MYQIYLIVPNPFKLTVETDWVSNLLTGCDQYSGPVPVPVDFSHSSTGSGPLPVKSKPLIPVPVSVPVKILIPIVSRFQSEVVLYKAMDILCVLLSGNFNPGRCGKIRAHDLRMTERMHLSIPLGRSWQNFWKKSHVSRS